MIRRSVIAVAAVIAFSAAAATTQAFADDTASVSMPALAAPVSVGTAPRAPASI